MPQWLGTGQTEESWGLSKVVTWVNKHTGAASLDVKSYRFCPQSWTILQYGCVETEGRFVVTRKNKTSVFRWMWVLFLFLHPLLILNEGPVD